jgi:lipid II:glycine glycyltransferase (peptidoglycan interpeptide bridge formation enzyme)
MQLTGRSVASTGAAAAVRLVDADGWSPGDWDDLAVRSPHGDVFQSHAWGELKRNLGWRPIRYVVELAGRPIAVCSIQEKSVVQRLGLGRLRVHYAPRGPILLEPGAETARLALAGLERLARTRTSVTLTIDPAWEEGSEPAQALEASRFRAARHDVQVSRTAMLVPLQPTDDAQHALLGDSTARNINKARRTGVTAERVDLSDPASSEAALAEFFEMHAATGRREGFIVRSRDYEMDQWRRLGSAGTASLWFAGVGRRDTGVLLLHCGQTLLSFAAGSREDAEMRRTRANHLLQWEIMRWAAANGFTHYDLGGVDIQSAPGIPRDESHPLWNLYEFKRGFGAEGVVRVRAHEYAPNPLLGIGWRLARRFR